jgi:hypothetical protein
MYRSRRPLYDSDVLVQQYCVLHVLSTRDSSTNNMDCIGFRHLYLHVRLSSWVRWEARLFFTRRFRENIAAAAVPGSKSWGLARIHALRCSFCSCVCSSSAAYLSAARLGPPIWSMGYVVDSCRVFGRNHGMMETRRILSRRRRVGSSSLYSTSCPDTTDSEADSEAE